MATRFNLMLLAAMLAVASSFSLPTPASKFFLRPHVPTISGPGVHLPSLQRLRGGTSVQGSAASPETAPPFSPKTLGKAMLAEAFGTFIVILLGCSSVAAANMALHPSGLLAISLIWGVAVAGAAQICGPVSGAHFNPAISIALATTKGSSSVPFNASKTSWLPFYIGAQLVGAFIASGLVAFFFWGYLGSLVKPLALPPGGVFGCYPSPAFGFSRAIASEVVGTGLLAAGCVAFPSSWHVGAWLASLIAIFGPISGASFNPAREFAPRLVASLIGFDWSMAVATAWPLYLFCPVIGAVIGAAITTALRSED